MKRFFCIFATLSCVLSFPRIAQCQEPQKVAICDLQESPATYNHKIVEVTGLISHGFEDFTLLDPSCPSWPAVWLEYGGTENSGTMYCCGVTNSRTRPKEIVVENIPIPLVDDGLFREFDREVQRLPDSLVHATLIGRFFSGSLTRDPKKRLFSSYGHLGCCSLLMIQQVLSVDPQDRQGLYYGHYPAAPNFKDDCEQGDLVPLEPYSSQIQAQEDAELGPRGWAFDDPERVAREGLLALAKLESESITDLKLVRRTRGSLVYRCKRRGRKTTYTLVVTRPYWLTFYAKDSKRIAWILNAAFETSCGKNSTSILAKSSGLAGAQ